MQKSRLYLGIGVSVLVLARAATATGQEGKAQFPSLKPGLWTAKMTTGSGAFNQVLDMRLCVGPSLTIFQQTASECKFSTRDLRPDHSFDYQAVCKDQNIDTTIHMSGDANVKVSATLAALDKNVDPKGENLQVQMSLEATYQGSCPSDMAPGDGYATGPDGRTVETHAPLG